MVNKNCVRMREFLTEHWPEYLMEAAELGIYMIAVCLFVILLYHPDSPAAHAIRAGFIRRILMGLAMGLTAVALVYSPWGQQSGAHMNPAFTLTFYRLGKVAPWDAVFYIAAQFLGAMCGVLLVAWFAANFLSHPAVNYVATIPGPGGAGLAFAGELCISFVFVLVVLTVSNTPRLSRFTGWFVGFCVAAFIIFELPISGMSMNPARTLGSAFLPHLWSSIWIYFVAPPVGMLLAAAAYQPAKHRVSCAKLHHQNSKRCIFCEYQAGSQARSAAKSAL